MNSYRHLTDQELATLFKEGNRCAYEEIYDRHWHSLFAHAKKILKNKEEAKDIMQDVFTHLWNSRETLSIENNVSGYLYGIMRFKTLDFIDRKNIRKKYLDSLCVFAAEHYENTDYLVREKQLTELIKKELMALPPKMREVFELNRNAHFIL